MPKRTKKVAKVVELKSPWVAAVLSFLIIGLGQIIKGIIFLVVGVLLWLSILVAIGFFLLPIFWIYNIYDAYTTAKRINAGEIVT